MRDLLLDTNVLLRLFLDDIPAQTLKVRQVIENSKKGKIKLHLPQIVIFEVEFSLRKYYKFDKEKVIGVLESLFSLDYLVVETRFIFSEALKIFRVANLDFVDCFLIAKSKFENKKLFSFDKKLQKYAKD